MRFEIPVWHEQEHCFGQNDNHCCTVLNDTHGYEDKRCPFIKLETVDLNLSVCHDKRACYHKLGDRRCRILHEPGTYAEGTCPFYKKKEVRFV